MTKTADKDGVPLSHIVNSVIKLTKFVSIIKIKNCFVK